MFTGKAQQDAVRGKVIHILPYHPGDVNTGMGLVQYKLLNLAVGFHSLHLAAAADIDQHKFTLPVCVLAPDHRRVGAENIEDALDIKGDTLVALNGNQPAPLITVTGKPEHMCFLHSPSQSLAAFSEHKSVVGLLALRGDLVLPAEFPGELINKGIGGECFKREIAETAEVIDADLITVAYGINDYTVFSQEEFTENCKGFISVLAEKYKNTPIYVITPIWSTLRGKKYKFGDVADVDRIISNICADFSNIKVIHGWDLVPHEEKYFGEFSYDNSRG